MVLGSMLGGVLLVTSVVASAVLAASALYYRYFERIAGDVETERAARVLRDGVALGGALVAVGLFGAALDSASTLLSLQSPEMGLSPLERAIVAAPTGWLPWLLALGFLLAVGSMVAASADQFRARYRD